MNKPAEMNTLAAISLWIDGKAQPATSTRSAGVTNPATGRVVRQVPLANAQDIDVAVASAQRAFPAWRDTPPLRRARILMKFRELLVAHHEELARLVT